MSSHGGGKVPALPELSGARRLYVRHDHSDRLCPNLQIRKARQPCLVEILKYSLETEVKLHAFVLMHHHLPRVVRLNDHMSGSAWMQQLKTQTAHLVGKHMTDRQRSYLSEQIGLNGRSFWKRSFRSVRIESEKVFWQKIRYCHLNPVRAGYCELESEYLWSSKRLWDDALWTEEAGLDVTSVLREYQVRVAVNSLHNSFLAVEAYKSSEDVPPDHGGAGQKPPRSRCPDVVS